MPVRSARPTPTRIGNTAARATADRWLGAAVLRTTSGSATLEPARAVTGSATAGMAGVPSRRDMVESPQRIEDAVVSLAVRTFRPSTLVPFALPRSTIVTSASDTSRRACSRESAGSGITIPAPPRPIRNRPRRNATRVPAPGPPCTANNNVAVSVRPGRTEVAPERYQPDVTSTDSQQAQKFSTSTAPWTRGAVPTVMAATREPRTNRWPVP